MAAGPTAAGGAWTSRTAHRRTQRRAYVAALRTKLEELSLADISDPEVRRRARLVVPCLAAGVHESHLDPMQRRRRNAASHSFQVSAATIAAADQRALNAIQRGWRGRRCIRAPDRQVNGLEAGRPPHCGAHAGHDAGREGEPAEEALRPDGGPGLAQRRPEPVRGEGQRPLQDGAGADGPDDQPRRDCLHEGLCSSSSGSSSSSSKPTTRATRRSPG